MLYSNERSMYLWEAMGFAHIQRSTVVGNTRDKEVQDISILPPVTFIITSVTLRLRLYQVLWGSELPLEICQASWIARQRSN